MDSSLIFSDNQARRSHEKEHSLIGQTLQNLPNEKAVDFGSRDSKIKKELRFDSDVLVIAGDDTCSVQKHSLEALGEVSSNSKLADRRASGVNDVLMTNKADKYCCICQ
ncbi:hypothetical protein RRG08_022136 [Elysia crispata]|uniref:Uncharacterized protein n=1 Tax=Elysia crispata TaxID=231223 RepID=A0AAE0Y0H3_9GAST|nr:hypothetical protein RRG08_022136 [Elysia crispata]